MDLVKEISQTRGGGVVVGPKSPQYSKGFEPLFVEEDEDYERREFEMNERLCSLIASEEEEDMDSEDNKDEQAGGEYETVASDDDDEDEGNEEEEASDSDLSFTDPSSSNVNTTNSTVEPSNNNTSGLSVVSSSSSAVPESNTRADNVSNISPWRKQPSQTFITTPIDIPSKTQPTEAESQQHQQNYGLQRLSSYEFKFLNEEDSSKPQGDGNEDAEDSEEDSESDPTLHEISRKQIIVIIKIKLESPKSRMSPILSTLGLISSQNLYIIKDS